MAQNSAENTARNAARDAAHDPARDAAPGTERSPARDTVVPDAPAPASPQPRSVSTPGARIHELDAIRGFALCGILIVNIYQQVVFRGSGAASSQLPLWVRLGFYERFLPVFAILFGIGFGLFLQRAGKRTDRPRMVLARRLGVLFLIGVVHYMLHPGEVLTAYALGGLLVLLPLSYLSGRVALVISLVLLVVGAQVVIGYGPIPGLLGLGYAMAALGMPEALGKRTGRVAAAFAVFAVLAVVYVTAVLNGVRLPAVNFVGGLGGGVGLLHPAGAIATSLAYASGFVLLLKTPLGPWLSDTLAPMGRMALTNYLSATVLFLVFGALLGIDEPDEVGLIVGLAVAILVVQAFWSRWWLARYRYGPVEWLWRCATWLQRAPNRKRERAAPTAAAA